MDTQQRTNLCVHCGAPPVVIHYSWCPEANRAQRIRGDKRADADRASVGLPADGSAC